jgi:hypothetical protein
MASRADERDAAALRDAAWVLQGRARKKTFLLRVMVRLLRRAADRIDSPAGGES